MSHYIRRIRTAATVRRPRKEWEKWFFLPCPQADYFVSGAYFLLICSRMRTVSLSRQRFRKNRMILFIFHCLSLNWIEYDKRNPLSVNCTMAVVGPFVFGSGKEPLSAHKKKAPCNAARCLRVVSAQRSRTRLFHERNTPYWYCANTGVFGLPTTAGYQYVSSSNSQSEQHILHLQYGDRRSLRWPSEPS